jgi:hypothetical protein
MEILELPVIVTGGSPAVFSVMWMTQIIGQASTE